MGETGGVPEGADGQIRGRAVDEGGEEVGAGSKWWQGSPTGGKRGGEFPGHAATTS